MYFMRKRFLESIKVCRECILKRFVYKSRNTVLPSEGNDSSGDEATGHKVSRVPFRNKFHYSRQSTKSQITENVSCNTPPHVPLHQFPRGKQVPRGSSQRLERLPSNEENFYENDMCVSDDLMKWDLPSFPVRKKFYKEEERTNEVLYGIHPVWLALEQKKRHFNKLYLKQLHKDGNQNSLRLQIEKLAKDSGVPVKKVDLRTLDSLSHCHVHQGVCLDCSKLKLDDYEEDNQKEYCAEHTPLWLVLDQIQDPMNFGAVLRSAYYFGLENVFIVNSCCRLSPVVSKASSGALEVMHLSAIQDLPSFLQKKKNEGWAIIGTKGYGKDVQEHTLESDNLKTLDVSDFVITKPTILVLGNEGDGISSSTINVCDVMLTVLSKQSLAPRIDSLNVSVATGIILHQLLKNHTSLIQN